MFKLSGSLVSNRWVVKSKIPILPLWEQVSFLSSYNYILFVERLSPFIFCNSLLGWCHFVFCVICFRCSDQVGNNIWHSMDTSKIAQLGLSNFKTIEEMLDDCVKSFQEKGFLWSYFLSNVFKIWIKYMEIGLFIYSFNFCMVESLISRKSLKYIFIKFFSGLSRRENSCWRHAF